MKLKKPADKSKSKAAVKATSEKLSKFYQDIANGEVTILPDLDIDELIETKLSNYNRNLLHLAVWYKQNEIVNQICRKEELKSLINEQDNNGDTPLHLAVFTMNVEAYRTLLLAGGDTTIRNNQNELPLEAIQDTKECEDLSQRLTTWTPNMLPDIKLTLIPDHSNILILSPMNSTKRDSWRSTAHSPLAMDSQTRPLVIKSSLNEPKSKFGSNNSETTGILSRSVSIAEDLADSDRENPKDMLDVVRSKIFKDPKTLSQVHECSIKDQSQSISYCKSSPKQRSNKKYGSSLLTKISSQTFYFTNKTPSKPIPEPDDWPKNEDLEF